MTELKMNQIEILEFKSLDTLSEYYERFDDICKKFKEVRGDNFEYDIDIDYDSMTLTFDLKFKEEANADTEGNPELN